MRTVVQKKKIIKNDVSRPRKYSKAFIEINEEIKFVKNEEELGNPFFEKVVNPDCCVLSQESKSKWTLCMQFEDKSYKIKPSKETNPVLVDKIIQFLQEKKIESLKKSAEEAENLIKSQVKNQLKKRQHELEVLVPIAENLERDSQKFEKTTNIVKKKKKYPLLFKIKTALLCGYNQENTPGRRNTNKSSEPEEDLDKIFESFRRKSLAAAANLSSPI